MSDCGMAMSDRFVAGELKADEEAHFVEHLESCAACRAALEHAAGDESTWNSAKYLLAFSSKSTEAHRPDSESLSEDHTPLGQSLTFLAPADDPRAIGRVGPYDILGVLGRGGMGIVLKGFDRPLNRNVAIKVLDPSAAAVGAARERFAREARAMAAISHEHVVPVYAVDVHAGLPYFVMEYVAGGSLETSLRARGPFDAVSVVRVGLQVAKSLAAAHRQGLVHRDIKPGNILIDSGTERVRVADFGLARVANDITCTRSGVISGTPHYMAPEQVRGEPCDAQSDLFSLGCVMYALCTGHPPFRAESVYGVMQRVLQDQPRSMIEQNPSIPNWLQQFVSRLLEKDKADRFHDADEVADILTAELAFSQNPTATAAPERRWAATPSAKRRTRRPLRTWLIGSAACLALATTGILLTQSGGEPTQNDSRPTPAAVDPAHSTAPLWFSDGMGQAQVQANALHHNWLETTGQQAPDSWTTDIAKARRAVEELSEEKVWRPQ